MFKAHWSKKKIKVVSLCSLLAFSVAATGIATICWFYADKNFKSGMDKIAVINDPTSFVVTYNVYGFNRNTKEGKLLYNQDTGFNFSLESYDAILKRNEYLSQIIEFTVKTTQINAPSGNINLEIPVDANFIADDTAKTVAEFMSNMIEFRYVLGSYTLRDGTVVKNIELGNLNRYYHDIDPTSTKEYSTSADKIYQEVHYELSKSSYTRKHYVDEAAIQAMPSPTDEENFVNAMKAVNKKKVDTNKNTLSFTIPHKTGDTYTVPDDYEEATFYLEFGYSDILTMFFSTNKNATITSGGKIAVGSDFNYIKVGVNKTTENT